MIIIAAFVNRLLLTAIFTLFSLEFIVREIMLEEIRTAHTCSLDAYLPRGALAVSRHAPRSPYKRCNRRSWRAECTRINWREKE